jgi:hypothetical protein
MEITPKNARLSFGTVVAIKHDSLRRSKLDFLFRTITLAGRTTFAQWVDITRILVTIGNEDVTICRVLADDG